MITKDPKPRLKAQDCPICGQEQDVIVNGTITREDGRLVASDELGYSFCNCNNIFFTSWENMDRKIYDDKYVQKYDGEKINGLLRKYVQFYWKYFKDKKAILDIGSINDGVLDEASDRGMESWGMDIAERPAKYPMIFGDFESMDLSKYLGKFGVITASHIFEHFRYPFKALMRCYDLLETGGRLFIAMPDPYFIVWKNPYMWGHWHSREHFIMWDMESWAKMMKSAGFKIIYKEHNVDPFFICTGDFHIIGEKV